jgi:hypothetical protein
VNTGLSCDLFSGQSLHSFDRQLPGTKIIALGQNIMPQNEKTGDDYHGCHSRRKLNTHDQTAKQFMTPGVPATLAGIFARFFTFWHF